MSKISRRVFIGAGTVAAVGGGYVATRRTALDLEPPAPAPVDGNGRALWSNWSGTAHAYPSARLLPRSEEELAGMVRGAAGPVRPVGAGHSFSAVAASDGTIVSFDAMTGLVAHDAATLQAVVRAGTRLGALGPALAEIGQEMPNLPDINKQSLAGALATGTHGTGKNLQALHAGVLAMRLVTPAGEIVDCSATSNRELFDAARVGLGAFGLVTQVTLQNRALTRVMKRTSIVETGQVLEDWASLTRAHRNVEFLVLPFTGRSLLIAHDETDASVSPRGPDRETEGLMNLKLLRDWLGFAPWVRRRLAAVFLDGEPPEVSVDEGWKLLSNERPVRFKEMEFHLPIEAQIPALRQVLEAIETHRRDVFFPIEARIIAPDDAWLSPFHGRETGSIAVHAYYKDDHGFLFDLVEPILRRHGGRPHWGKLHSLSGRDLAALYPKWRDALAMRREMDPQGRLLNPHLARIFDHG